MSLVRRHPLWTLVAVGVAIRLGFAFAFVGNYDVAVAWPWVDGALDRDPIHVYDVNSGARDGLGFFWPYAPLYLIGIALPSAISDLTGLPYHGTFELLPILADVGIALAVHAYLGWRGAGDRARLAGAALVLLGPCFIAISGYHGQFDQVAILPAVLALMVWERGRADRRAVDSGLLVGIGAAIKTVPGIFVLPLAASARSVSEGVRMIVAAVAVPLLLLVPFFVADPSAVLELREYRGLPGLGGPSLLVEPELGSAWMINAQALHDSGPLATFLSEQAGVITTVALAALAAFLFRYRPAPIDGAVLLWLTVYVFSPNFFLQYLIWGLPFFIMAGYLREVAILQLGLIPAIVTFYMAPYSDEMPAAGIYVPSMIALWAFWVVALATLATRVARGRRPAFAGT